MTITAPRRMRQYQRASGTPLAASPKAFFELFFERPAPPANQVIGNAIVVDVRGPLDAHVGWCDSYEAIRTRIDDACESPAAAIVLRFDSPGGDVMNCFDTARQIRARCALAGKPLIAYAEGCAHSAAYALACAASEIVISDSATVGSIGVITTRDDISAMNTQRGLRVAFITSGARKADGHPESPLTDAELEATQSIVDSMADDFFALVSELRGADPDALRLLDAGVFHGADAIDRGLADSIESFDALIARLTTGANVTAKAKAKKPTYDETLESLRSLAEGDDANAEAAKRALAAMESPAPAEDADKDKDKEAPAAEDEDEDDTAAESEDEEKPAAESEDEEAPAAESEDDKPKSATAAMRATLTKALARIHRLEANAAQSTTRGERQRLIDSRPDFAPEFRTLLQTAPMTQVRHYVKTLPRGASANGKAKASSARAVLDTAQAAAKAAPTRGAADPLGGSGPQPTAADEAYLDRAMGLTHTKIGAKHSPFKLTLGAPLPADPATPPRPAN